MLFFDFEVFIKDWLVVILDMDNRKEHVIINSPSDLKQFYQELVNGYFSVHSERDPVCEYSVS